MRAAQETNTVPSTSEEERFLSAIRENPDDDSLRLVYADWLEERGDPRGEFIRIHFELEKLKPDEGRALRAREIQLLADNKEKWFGEIRKRFRFWECHRGFLDEIHGNVDTFLAYANELFRQHPVQHVTLNGVGMLGGGYVTELACCRHLPYLMSLRIGGHLTITQLRTFLARADLRRLKMLDLEGNNLANGGAKALATCASLRRLTRLSLRNNRIGESGARALVRSSHLVCLVELDVRGNPLGDVEIAALTRRYGRGVLFGG
jgi:uncharacterized protein (TIGR02996 family)